MQQYSKKKFLNKRGGEQEKEREGEKERKMEIRKYFRKLRQSYDSTWKRYGNLKY